MRKAKSIEDTNAGGTKQYFASAEQQLVIKL